MSTTILSCNLRCYHAMGCISSTTSDFCGISIGLLYLAFGYPQLTYKAVGWSPSSSELFPLTVTFLVWETLAVALRINGMLTQRCAPNHHHTHTQQGRDSNWLEEMSTGRQNSFLCSAHGTKPVCLQYCCTLFWDLKKKKKTSNM